MSTKDRETGGDKENYAGIMLTMKKRMALTDEDDTSQSQYTLFGHYDGMDIQILEQWYEMRPKRVGNYNGNTSVADSYSDKHTLKGYFPRKRISEKLEKLGIHYEFWKMAGSQHQGKRKANQKKLMLNKVPFITVSVVNLSGEFVEHEKNSSNLILSLSRELKIVAQKNGISLEDIHCAVIPSIGYADFIILFHSNDLAQNIRILDGLKGCTMSDAKGCSYAVISNSYSISGVYPSGIHQLPKKKESAVKVSIRIILKEGISTGEFDKNFNREFDNFKTNYGLSAATECFQLFGNSDCMILADMPVELFISLYFEKGFLNPSSEFFKNHIKSLYSSLIISVEGDTSVEYQKIAGEEGTEGNEDGDSLKEKPYKVRQEQFETFISALEKFCKANQCPIRLSVGLQTVMKTFLNFIQSSHCCDINRIIGDAFDVLCDVVTKDMETIRSIDEDLTILKRKIRKTDVKGERSRRNVERWEREMEELQQYRCHLLNNTIKSLSIFRERIGDYLIDLQRSDSSFMEGQSLSHPSIGSATKLLFFYNYFVNDIAKKLVETEGEHNYRDTYTFVVTSGGCDKANSCDLFSYRDPSAEGNCSLIILTIPEMSLYDVRGTLFRILHEVLHFCGKRLRCQRANYFMQAISLYIGTVFGQMQYHSLVEGEFFETIALAAASRLSAEETAEMEQKIKDIVGKHCDGIKSDAAGYLTTQTAIEQYISLTVPYNSLFGTFLSEDAREILYHILIPQVGCSAMEKGNGILSSWLYQDISRHYKEILDELLTEFEGTGIQYSQLNIANQKAEYYLKNWRCGDFDKKSYRFIQVILHKFLGNRIFLDDGQEYVRRDIFSLDELSDSILLVMQELYSDCIAVTVLGMNIEDFLLAFVYEMWDIQQAFPVTLLNVMRVGAELNILYGVTDRLEEEQRSAIIKKCGYWENCGFEYQLDASKLCDWIDDLLKMYQDMNCESFMGPVKEYIKACVKIFRNNRDFSSERSFYKLTDIENNDALYDMLDSIIRQWKMLSAAKQEAVKE
ncbi:MAG: hypothetical protein ACLSXO_05395 [Coprococcus sp.]